MNKQEFQQKIKDMKPPRFFNAVTLREAYEAGFEEAKNNALYNSCFLNELKKPVVPQFVADWYEESKDYFEMNLYNLCVDFHKRKLPADLYEWSNKLSDKPIETLVKMKLFGYEVEHEQQYVVAIPDDGRNGFIQLWKNREGKLLFNFEDKIKYGKVHLLTEQEIKQKDERLWQFAKEVEQCNQKH